MSIIISTNGKKAVRVEKTPFDKEHKLQEYIYENPESIPIYEIKEDIKLLILAREFPTNSGPIDAIGVDKDGEIYIVETKLFNNPDKRTVIAQALDYGAALWKHSANFDEFIGILDEHTQKMFSLRAGEKVKEFFNLSDEEVVALIDRMRANLSDGSFHFVILMDELGDRLKDLILYVNQNSQFNIYAVELEYYKHESQEIIIPKIFGAEVKKEVITARGDSSRQTWNEERLLQSAKDNLSGEAFAGFKSLYDFSKQSASSVNLGSGTTRGSFGPVFEGISDRTIFTLRSDSAGTLSFNFGWINDSERAKKFRSAYFSKMKELGFNENMDIEKYPRFTAEEWVPKVKELITAIKELVRNA